MRLTWWFPIRRRAEAQGCRKRARAEAEKAKAEAKGEAEQTGIDPGGEAGRLALGRRWVPRFARVPRLGGASQFRFRPLRVSSWRAASACLAFGGAGRGMHLSVPNGKVRYPISDGPPVRRESPV